MGPAGERYHLALIGIERGDTMRWSAAQALGWIIRQAPLEIGPWPKPSGTVEAHWTSDMSPGLKDAQKELTQAIAAGRVQAWGRPTPHGRIKKVPSDLFRIRGLPVVVDPYGEMTSSLPHKPYPTKDDPKWHSIEFEPGEIKTAWPAPPPQTATDWMKNEAERLKAEGRIGKRDAMVTDCIKATGCTKRQAEAAHKALPQGVRRSRGKPPKSSG